MIWLRTFSLTPKSPPRNEEFQAMVAERMPSIGSGRSIGSGMSRGFGNACLGSKSGP
jgi:hypothetical protein